MNEAGLWRKVKGHLHRPTAATRRGVAWKVQDAFNAGLPDADVVLHDPVDRRFSVTIKLELKYAAAWPVRGGPLEIAVTEHQLRMLLEWQAGGGNALVLLGVGKEWFLLDPQKFPGPKPRLLEAEVRAQALAMGAIADGLALRQALMDAAART